MLPPDSLAELFSLFRGCFTRPTYRTFCSLCSGFIARVGEHTVTGMLLATGLEQSWHHSRAHDFFSRRHWSADALGLRLLEFVVERFLAADAPLRLAVDDTIFARSGPKVFGAHLHRQDSVHGGGKQVRYGNCWVVLGIVLALPFGERQIFLPLLFRLWQADPARRGHGRKGLPYKRSKDPAYPSQSEFARELVNLVHTRYPKRDIELLGDGAYATKAMRGLPEAVRMIARLKSSCTLYAFPTEKDPHRRGRAPLKGERLGRVKEIAAAASDSFVEIAPKGAGLPPTLSVYTLDCLWFGVLHTRPVRVVIVADPKGKHAMAMALVSTDATLSAQEIVERYSLRWTIEVCFRDAKQLSGVGEARNRTPRAVMRTVPFGFLCQSLTVAWYMLNGDPSGDVKARRRHAPWYRHKRSPSYGDMLVALRRAMIAVEFPRESVPEPKQRKFSRSARGVGLAAA
jgi:DDE superfamily endonuclease